MLQRSPDNATMALDVSQFIQHGHVIEVKGRTEPGARVMVNGQQRARSLLHCAELFRLADDAGLLEQPELAVKRMRALLALHGVE